MAIDFDCILKKTAFRTRELRALEVKLQLISDEYAAMSRQDDCDNDELGALGDEGNETSVQIEVVRAEEYYAQCSFTYNNVLTLRLMSAGDVKSFVQWYATQLATKFDFMADDGRADFLLDAAPRIFHAMQHILLRDLGRTFRIPEEIPDTIPHHRYKMGGAYEIIKIDRIPEYRIRGLLQEISEFASQLGCDEPKRRAEPNQNRIDLVASWRWFRDNSRNLTRPPDLPRCHKSTFAEFAQYCIYLAYSNPLLELNFDDAEPDPTKKGGAVASAAVDAAESWLENHNQIASVDTESSKFKGLYEESFGPLKKMPRNRGR